MRCFFVLIGLLVTVFPAWAQQEGVLQINDRVHQFLLRQQASGRLPEAFLSHQPLSAYEAQRYLDSLSLRAHGLSRVDQRMLARFRGTEPGPGATAVQRLVPFAYQNGRNVVAVRHEDYGFEIDPLAYLAYGQAQQTAREGRDGSTTV